PAVYYPAVIPALVEHTQVYAQNAGKVQVPVHGALIGADAHEVLLVELYVRHILEDLLQYLVGGHNVVKAHEGHSIAEPGVMGVKGDDVGNAHGLKFLKSHSAVQAFPADPAMLPSAVEAGHNDSDPVSLTGH